MHDRTLLQLNAKQKRLYQKNLISEIYPEYYLIKVNNFNDLAKDTLDQWIYFLKNEEIKPEFNAKGLQEAKRKLDILNLPDAERNAYKRYQDNLHYKASMVESSYGEGKLDGLDEGLEQGVKKGKQDREIEIVINMFNAKVQIENIAEFTGLSVTIINELVKIKL